MPKHANEQEIEDFLKEFRNCWDGKVLDERQDGKNDETLALLGITPEHRAEIVRGLSCKDYSKGPEPDKDSAWSGDVWIFGKKVRGEMIYIKIKIAMTKRTQTKYGKCLSFHFEEYPLTFPFKGENHA